MAGPYNGPLHTLGMKQQGTPGTPETTVTNFFSTDNFSMNARPGLVPRKSSQGTGMVLPGRQGWIMPEGAATIEAHASQPHPWYYALGKDTVTTPSGTVKLHTITYDPTVLLPVTIEGNKIYNKAKQGDCVLNTLTFNFKVLELAELVLGWMGLSHVEPATLTSTPSFTTNPLGTMAVNISIAGSQNFTVDSGSISWDNKCEQKPALTNASAGQPQQIRRKERPECKGQLDFIDFPADQLAAFLAATPFALIVELKGVVISTTYYEMLRVTLPACQYDGGLDSAAGQEAITGTANFTAYDDLATGNQIKVEAQTNNIASLAA